MSQRSAKSYAAAQRKLARSPTTQRVALPRQVDHECGGSKQPHYLMYLTEKEIAFVLEHMAGTPTGADGPEGVKCGPPDGVPEGVRTRRVFLAGGEEVLIPVPADPADDTVWAFANAVERETGLSGPFYLQYQLGTREPDQPAVVLNVGNKTKLPADGMHNVAQMADAELVTNTMTPMARFDTTDPRYGEVVATAGWVVDPTMQGEDRYFDLTNHEIARYSPYWGTVRELVVQYTPGRSTVDIESRHGNPPVGIPLSVIEGVLVPNSGRYGEDQWYRYYGNANVGRLGETMEDPFAVDDELYEDVD